MVAKKSCICSDRELERKDYWPGCPEHGKDRPGQGRAFPAAPPVPEPLKKSLAELVMGPVLVPGPLQPSLPGLEAEKAPDANGFKKWDQEKPQLEILMSAWRGLTLPAAVMAFGAKKYGRDNWQLCTDVGRYKNALLRHMGAIAEGEALDAQSGLPHIGHLACNAIFLCWFHVMGKWDGK